MASLSPTPEAVEEVRQAITLADKASLPLIPLAHHGEIGNGRADESRGSDRTSTRGETQAYLLRRLARDAPEILERVKAGEFKSVRAAAIAAGIIRPIPTIRLAAMKKAPPCDGADYRA